MRLTRNYTGQTDRENKKSWVNFPHLRFLEGPRRPKERDERYPTAGKECERRIPICISDSPLRIATAWKKNKKRGLNSLSHPFKVFGSRMKIPNNAGWLLPMRFEKLFDLDWLSQCQLQGNGKDSIVSLRFFFSLANCTNPLRPKIRSWNILQNTNLLLKDELLTVKRGRWHTNRY